MFKINRERIGRVSKWMYGLASLSTVATIIGIVLYTQPECRWSYSGYYGGYTECYYNTIVGAGIWGPALTWPAAICAHLASRKNSGRCVLIAHLVLCILAVFLTLAAVITEVIILSTDWVSYYYDPNEYAQSVMAMMSLSTITLFALSILSICSSGFSCKYLCCPCGDQSVDGITPVTPMAPSGLLGVQFVQQGNVKYYPAGTNEVTEITTEQGRMVIVNVPQVDTDEPATSAPPAYSTVAEKDQYE